MSETVEDVLAKGGQDTDPAEENFGTGCSSCTAAGSGIPSGTVPPALGYGTSASPLPSLR
jgi:hypothetical protein